jgi:hypothetical protein
LLDLIKVKEAIMRIWSLALVAILGIVTASGAVQETKQAKK